MSPFRFVLALVLLAVSIVARPAQAVPPACGASITASFTLDGNMTCPTGNGLNIGANGVTINGGGFTISAPGGSAITSSNASNTTIFNVVIDGGTAADGIVITGSNNVVRDSTVRNRRYGVYLIGSNNRIENVIARGCRDYSLMIASGTGAIFRNNDARDGITASTNHYYLSSLSGALTFTGNRAEGVGTGMRFDGSSGITIDNLTAGNVFTGLTGHGLYATSTTNVTVSNWTLVGPAANYGIYLAGSSGRVANVNASNFQYGIYVSGSGHVIENNSCTNNSDAGLRFGESALTIRNNNFSGNRAYSVYTATYTGALAFTGNDLRNSPRALQFDTTNGVTLDNTSAGNLLGTNATCGFCGTSNNNMVIRGWDFTGAGRAGAGASVGGANVTLENLTADERDNGLSLSGDRFTVRNLKARRSNWGVYLVGSSDSTIVDSDLTSSASASLRFGNATGSMFVSGNDFRNSARILYVDSARDITFDNAATGITPNLVGTHSSNAFEIYAATRVTVKNWNITGGGGAAVYMSGASESVVQNVTATGRTVGANIGGIGNAIRNCSFTNSASYNVILYGSDATLENNNLRGGTGAALRFETYVGGVTARGNDYRDAAIGVFLNGARDLVVEPPATGAANTFGNNPSGVYITSASANIIVRNLDLSGSGTGYGVYSDGPNTTIENVVANQRQNGLYTTNIGTTVRGCTVRRPTERGLHVRRGGATIVNNDFSGAGLYSINFYDYAGAVTMENNDFRGSNYVFGLEIVRGIILDNQPAGGLPNLTGTNGSGGVTGSGEAAIIRNWDFSGGGSGYGVYLTGVGHKMENVVANNRANGFRFDGRNASLVGCTANNARDAGAWLFVSGATVTDSTFKFAGHSGIYLYTYVGAATLTGNDVTGSARGLYLYQALDTSIDQSGGAAGMPNVFGDNSTCTICGDGSGLTFTGVDASGRGAGNGIEIIGNNILVRRATAKNRVTGISLNGRNDVVDDSLVRDNTNGVLLTGQAHTVSNSRLCWNTTAGLTYNGSDVTEARGNFWGTPSGPRLTANPGGTGNAITGTGLTQWSPFLTDGAGCESNLAVRNLEVTGLVDAVAGTVQSVRVRALDRYGAVVDGYAGTVAFASNDTAAVLPSASTLTAGVRTAPVTLKTAGSRTLTVYDTGFPDLTTTVRVNVLPNPGAARLTRVSGDGQSSAAGSALPLPLKVLLDDVYGNPLVGRDVTFAVLSGGGGVAAPTGTTDAAGFASIVATTGQSVGTNQFAASFGTALGSPVSFTATGVPGEVARLEFTGLADSVVAGAVQSVRVRARDRYDNLVVGYTGPVQFSSTDPNAITPAISTLTGGDGTFDVTFKTAGTQVVSVADVRYVGFRTSQVTTVRAAAASRLFLVSGNAQVAEAGTQAPEALVVGASDRFGNPVSGVSVTFSPGADGAVLPATTTTDARGQASTLATVATREGANDFTASASGLTGSPVRFQLLSTAGPASTLVYVSGGGLSGRVGQALLAPLVVLTADRFGNRVGNSAVRFRALAAGASVTPTLVNSDNTGIAQATATLGPTAGLQRFEAYATFASTAVPFEETAVGGDAAGMRLLDGDAQSGQVGTALAQPLRVIVEDSRGNPVPRVAVGFATGTGSSATIAPAFVVTDAAGIASATATFGERAGPLSFVATSPGLANSPITFTATARPGPATRVVYVSGRDQSATVATSLPAPLVVRTADAFGNAVANVAVTFAALAPGASIDPTAVTSDATGLASATATLGPTAGTQSFEARTADGGSTVTIDSAGTPGAPASLTLVDGDAQDGTVGRALALPLRVRVDDAHGNAVPGVSIDFLANTSGASISPATAETDAAGLAQATGTLPETTGAVTFDAAASDTGLDAVTFTATALPGPARRIIVSGVPSPIAAGTAAEASLVAQDAFGNVATAYSGPVRLSSSDTRASLATPVTLVDGRGTTSVTFQSAGRQVLRARDDVDSTIAGEQADIEVTAAPELAFTLTVPAGQQVVGTPVRVTLTVQDAFGNEVPGARAVTILADNDAAFSGSTLDESTGLGSGETGGLTDASGHATLTLSTLTAGDVVVTARAEGVTTANGTIRFTPANADRLTVKPIAGTSALACECLTVAVQLSDAFGNDVGTALAGVALAVSGTATLTETSLASPVGTLPGAKVTGRLSARGGATATVCGDQAERVTFEASHPQLPGRSGTLALDFALGALSPTLSALTSDRSRVQTRQGRALFTLVPKDECGNDLGPAQDVALSTSAGTLAPVTDLGDGRYTAEFSVAECPESGTATVSATVDGTSVATPVTLEIECVPLSTTLTNVTLTRVATPLCDDRTKSQVGIRVEPKDENGAPLGAGTDVAVTIEGLVGGTFTETDDGAYLAEFSVDTCSATQRPVHVTVNGVDVPRDAMSVTFSCPAIDPAASSLTLERTEIRADGLDATKVVAEAVTECGEPAKGRPIAFTLAVGTLAAGSTLDDAGRIEGTLTSTVAGLDTITATVDGTPIGTREVNYRLAVRYGGGFASCGCNGADPGTLGLLAAGLLVLRRRRGGARLV